MTKDRETSSQGEHRKNKKLSTWSLIAGACCLAVVATGGGGYAVYLHQQRQKFNTFLNEGDSAFKSHNWNTALGLYKQAQSIRNNPEVSTEIQQTLQVLQWTKMLDSKNNLQGLTKLYGVLKESKSSESSFVNPFISQTQLAMVNAAVSQMKSWFPDYYQSDGSIKFNGPIVDANVESIQSDQSNLEKAVGVYNQLVHTVGEPMSGLRNDIYQVASAAQGATSYGDGTDYQDAEAIVNIVKGIVTSKELSRLKSVVKMEKQNYEEFNASQSASSQSSNQQSSDSSNQNLNSGNYQTENQQATQSVNQAENSILSPPTNLSAADTSFLGELGSFVQDSDGCYSNYASDISQNVAGDFTGQ